MSLENRRTFLRRASRIARLSLLGGGAALGCDGLLERHRVQVDSRRLDLALGPHAPPQWRAVVLSDFHFDPLCEGDYVERCVRLANSLRPDVVFLTGDFITSSHRSIGELAGLLASLQPAHGVFACLGNHDFWNQPDKVAAALRKRDIEVLLNQQTRVSCGGGELAVAGLESAWSGKPNWAQAARGLRDGERAVMLMHEPDYISNFRNDRRVALQLSGHTHGGQVCLPGGIALRLPSWGLRYPAGLFQVEGLPLYVTRGIGTIRVPVRLFCPPEITCLDIHNTAAPAVA